MGKDNASFAFLKVILTFYPLTFVKIKIQSNKISSNFIYYFSVMLTAPLHPKEEERQKELESYRIIDSMPEEEYDELVLLASEICDTPISLITLIDKDRQWFKAKVGMEVNETPRDLAFCAHAIHEPNQIFEVTDATKDVRFHDNPLVVSDPNVIFYAGVSLETENGLPLGTLCVIDHQPKKLTERQEKALKILAKRVVNLLELRKKKAELKQLNRELSFKNEALEKFSYTTAHDLKSPLNNIISLTEFLQESLVLKDENHQKMLQWIYQSSLKLKNMIDAMLEYSKSGKLFANQREWFNPAEEVHSIFKLYAFRNDCHFTYDATISSIHTTKIVYQQILLNLISNSVKYGDKPSNEIMVSITEDDKFYITQVADNGRGIAKENMPKLFDLFEVFSENNNEGERGTGIGLSTVKRLIVEMKGSIEVDSELGVGTTFTFKIPK